MVSFKSSDKIHAGGIRGCSVSTTSSYYYYSASSIVLVILMAVVTVLAVCIIVLVIVLVIKVMPVLFRIFSRLLSWSRIAFISSSLYSTGYTHRLERP